MSMKSLTITPPRSRRRICRQISCGRLEVDLVGVLFGVVVGAEVPAVDVDGDQGFGLVDDERTAPFERDVPHWIRAISSSILYWWNSGSLPSYSWMRSACRGSTTFRNSRARS